MPPFRHIDSGKLAPIEVLLLPNRQREAFAIQQWLAGAFRNKKACWHYYQLNFAYSTFCERLKGRTSHKINHSMLNPTQELALLAWINTHLITGNEISPRKVAIATQWLLRNDGDSRTITKRWAYRWLNRMNKRGILHNPKTTSLSTLRKAALTRDDVEGTLRVLQITRDRLQIEPLNEWNADESGFRHGVFDRRTKAWTYIGIPSVVRSDPDNRELITVLEAISAAGTTIPPFVILPGVYLKARHIENSLDNGTLLAVSPNGYITDQLALDWISHFDRHAKPTDIAAKRLLIMDNHGSHCTIQFHQLCAKANIELFLLPPHSTHKLQPLDVGIFRVYKACHTADMIRKLDTEIDYTKLDFLDGLYYIRNRALKPRNIRSAWQLSGLWPLNPSLVLNTMEDPLNSALDYSIFQRAPGYIANHKESHMGWETEDDRAKRYQYRDYYLMLVAEGLEYIQPIMDFRAPSPPPSIVVDWDLAVTPELNMGILRHYQEYIDNELKAAIVEARPPSQTIIHVMAKRNKAANAMASLTALSRESEIHRRELQIRERLEASKRQNRQLTTYGPVVVGDHRFKLAAIDKAITEKKQKNERTRFAREYTTEVGLVRRWMVSYRQAIEALIKNQKARLRATGMTNRKLLNTAVKATLGLIKDQDTMLQKYRETRSERQQYWQDQRDIEIIELARISQRQPVEVQLNVYWAPPEDPMGSTQTPLPWTFIPEFMEVAIEAYTAQKDDLEAVKSKAYLIWRQLQHLQDEVDLSNENEDEDGDSEDGDGEISNALIRDSDVEGDTIYCK